MTGLLVFLALGASPDGIPWRDWSDAVFHESRHTGKPVLVELTASWCHACNRLETETLRDPRVRERIRAETIPVRVDVDRHPDLHLRFHVALDGLPTLLLLDAGGEVIRYANFLNAVEMLDFLGRDLRDDLRPPPRRELGDPRDPGATVRSVVDELLEDRARTGSLWADGIYLESDALLLLAEVAERRVYRADSCRAVFLATLNELLHAPVYDLEEDGFFRYARRVEEGPHTEKLLFVQALMLDALNRARDLAGETRGRPYRFAAHGLRRFVESFFPLAGSEPLLAVARNADVVDPVTGEILMTGRDYYARSREARVGVPAPRLEPFAYVESNALWASAVLERGEPGPGGARGSCRSSPIPARAPRPAEPWPPSGRPCSKPGSRSGPGRWGRRFWHRTGERTGRSPRDRVPPTRCFWWGGTTG